ncbi:putative helicase [Sugiyamaella lignohabitans]|uniref:Putative helicase n=1 Tax=Sugiyamaella lignohabitans TaxID=796027 RepID=A0A167D5R3_9ASCO|nr:putative helicase [Sugiyamaella lignohabitans]ANB12516.1 putative helicase [Sugiyamaella lignohabitans]
MLLPGPHKDLWAKLDDVKKATPPNQVPFLYNADPFQAERDKKVQKAQAADEHKLKQEQREKQSIVNSVKVTLKSEEHSRSSSPQPAGGETPTTPPTRERRVRFNNVLGMSKTSRSLTESTIRKYHGFQLQSSEVGSKAGTNHAQLMTTLKKLGFEDSQAKEALENNSSLSGSLEWLLIHVPEDDLPELFTRNKHLGSQANVQGGDLKLEYAVREIRKYGFAEEVIRDALARSRGDKRLAMVSLTHRLVSGSDDKNSVETSDSTNEEASVSAWSDEVESLQSIYPENEFKIDKETDKCTVLANLQSANSKSPKISISFWRSSDYPNSIPGLALEVIESAKRIPNYILLDVIKQAGTYAVENFRSDFMIMSICEWINDMFMEIYKSPSKLSEISGAVSGDFEKSLKDKTAGSKGKSTRHRTSNKSAFGPSSEALKQEYDEKLAKSSQLRSMIESRKDLPAWKKQQQIVDLVTKNQITLITGETGSGKSTQVVQFVLDDMISKNTGSACNIICTQPRRISAMGVAQRVADERDTPIGEQVGYVIRGESKVSNNTKLRFVTSGVLLRMIQTDPEGALQGVSHVVVDEVHERSLDSDYLLILLKRICKANKNLKVILMSATVDPKLFINYFDNKVGYTHIEGRTFPVEDHFLDDVIRQTQYIPRSLEDDEDISPNDIGRIIVALKGGVEYDLIVKLINQIHSNLGSDKGSILVFMSGAAEIDKCISTINNSSNGYSYYALPLHASLTPAEQRRVFPAAPAGKRKIVVSTNVAETSITIPDIVAVIDSGRVKETVYDPQSNVVKLVDNWASQAAVTQRRGRAGRVQKGTCYKLYTENIQQNEMLPRPAPEMARAPLEQLYLSVKSMGVGDVRKFLSEALDPPETAALDVARNSLIKAGALESVSDNLTSLGRHISTIPADVRTAKLLILSAMFGCLSTGLTLVSILSLRSPFVSPREKREEAKKAMLGFEGPGHGDLLCAVTAYEQWLEKRNTLSSSGIRNWAKDNYLSIQTLHDISSARKQFLSNLQEIGFISSSNERSIPAYYYGQEGNEALIRAIIGAAMSPNLAEIVFPEKTFKAVSSGTVEQDAEAKGIKFFNDQMERVFIHPSSSLFGVNKFLYDSKYISYATKMSTTKLFINGLTPVSTYGMLFFSNSITVDPLGEGIIVDGWLGLKCWPRVGILVRLLRKLFNSLLDSKFADPRLDISKHEIMDIVQKLIQSDGQYK